ncbi:MAG: hypothetical protein JOZ02_12845 [Acidobacteria bacterium]|nr:hypothetical protein [Acidobacteriota bacterium]
MPTDIEQLVANLKANNGELVEAIALLTGVLQKVAAKLDDPDITAAVNAVKGHIKAVELPKRDPPGCRLRRFEELPEAAREVLGPGWRDFFNQQNP